MSTTARADWRTPTAVLICGGLILTLALGLRHGFGLFLQPMTSDLNWGRESFALALAVQNLVWGASQPFAGVIADKYGAGRVAAGGAVLYIAGLALMAYPFAPWFFVLSSGVLIGMGLSGVTFSLVLGVIGRRYPPEKRSMALGIAAAAAVAPATLIKCRRSNSNRSPSHTGQDSFRFVIGSFLSRKGGR